MLSLIFNASVVLTNHQIIEGIVGKRQKLVILSAIALLAINGSLFIFFNSIRGHIHSASASEFALGVPAASMLTISLVLFVATHLLRRRSGADKTA